MNHGGLSSSSCTHCSANVYSRPSHVRRTSAKHDLSSICRQGRSDSEKCYAGPKRQRRRNRRGVQHPVAAVPVPNSLVNPEIVDFTAYFLKVGGLLRRLSRERAKPLVKWAPVFGRARFLPSRCGQAPGCGTAGASPSQAHNHSRLHPHCVAVESNRGSLP